MLSTLIAGFLLFSPPLNYYADGPYDSSVPRPEALLGYGPGQQHTTFRDLERVGLAISDRARDRVRVFEYGISVSGRPLRIFAISSPANIARLEQIRKEHAELANGKGDPSKTVPIVWINEGIHGNETASFEAGMWTLYNLAASRNPRITKSLEDVVVILNPAYNPDGHERFVVYYNSVATGAAEPFAFEKSEPGVVGGRTNHYRFDMNRDRVSFSQDETRQEFKEFLRWNPQVYVDQHGQVETYFFPPDAKAINVNVDRERFEKWNDFFGRATARAFDEKGYLYFIRETFDFYMPGYLDASTSLSGAIGMTHETDGGRYLARERTDGSILTLRDGMDKHFTSARAVILATAEKGPDLLASYANFKKRACDGTLAGKFQRVVVTSEDIRPLERLREQLALGGIHSAYALSEFRQEDANDYWTGKREPTTFPAGSLVIDLAQSQAALAKALLEPHSDFEDDFTKEQIDKKKAAPEGEKYPGPESTEFYDMTGWALPYAHNLKAWWCESRPEVPRSDAVEVAAYNLRESGIGYLLRYRDTQDCLAVYDALAAGVRSMVSTKPMKFGGRSYPTGTFLFFAARNEDGYRRKLEEIGTRRNVVFEPISTAYPDEGTRFGPGSEMVQVVRKPAIAVVMGSGSQLYNSGPIWYLMDRVFKLPFTPLNASALSSADLNKYTCIVLPNGAQGSSTGKLREWMDRGGTVVSLEGVGWAIGSASLVNLETVKGEPQSLPGSLFRAELDSRSFLSYGYHSPEIAVPIGGSRFYQVRKEGGSIVKLSADEKVAKLLTGWSWPDDTEKHLQGTVWLQDVPVGRGHAILFTQDPTERAMWPGLYKLLLNAMLLGPS